MIHHPPDCTYCKYYLQRNEAQRVSKQKIDLVMFEHCSKHDRRVVPPGTPGRWCEDYQKKDCPCPKCNN